MNITHYLTLLEHEYSAKNKLQKEALEFFRSINRMLIQASDLEELKKKILEGISNLNQMNPRCTPIEIRFTECHPLKCEIMITGCQSVVFYIRAATLTHLSTI